MTSSTDPFVQDLRKAFVAEHQRWIANAQRHADDAAARGDEKNRKWHQEDADRLRAQRYPWEGEET